MSNLRGLLRHLVEESGTLTVEQGRAAVEEILRGEVSDAEISALVTAIGTRGATADELTGFVQGIRAFGRPVPFTKEERNQLVDTCGTGGDERGTFNISTGAALVAAAAGAKVAKHGNRGVTSKCGSADVLEALGVEVEFEPEQAVECLRSTGFVFLYAPLLHPALKRAQHVRRALGFRTIFNLAGPLSNPAGAKAQVLGVFASRWVAVVGEAMAKLGTRHSLVFHGTDGLDELALDGPNEIAEVRGHTVRLFQMRASEAGLEPAPLSALSGGDAQANALILEQILRGERGPRRDVVLLNAAGALMVAELATDFAEGIRICAQAIDSGAALEVLIRLREFKLRHRR